MIRPAGDDPNGFFHIELGSKDRRDRNADPLVRPRVGKKKIMHRLVLEDVSGLAAGADEDEGDRVSPP